MQELTDDDLRVGSVVDDIVARLTACMRGQDFKSLDRLADEVLALAVTGDDPVLLAAAAECRAQADYYLGRYPTALRAFGEAIERWHRLGDAPGEARARLGHSGVLSNCGLTSESLEEAHAALALLDEWSDFPLYVGALLAIARVQTVLRGWQEADRLYGRALTLARSRNDDHEIGRVLVDLGYFYCERSREARTMGDHGRLHDFATRGLACNREALALFRSTGQSKLEWVALANLGEGLMDLGHLGEARSTIEEVLRSVRLSSAPSMYVQGEAMLHLGQISLAEGRHDGAVEELLQALAIARQQGMNEMIMKSCELLTVAYEAAGDFRNALDHHKQYFAAHVQILSEAAQLRASVLTIELETVEARKAVEVARAHSQALARDNLELQRESLEDSMTGLPNYRSFQRNLDRFVVEHSRTEADFFLAVIDVDNFKSINDRFSHSTGDAVLKGVADVLRHEIRQCDVAARYGGEEFTVMLAACSGADARAACERIRHAIAAHAWGALNERLTVTVSIGLVGSSECADRRMYRAKGLGKNQVVATDG